MFFPPKLYGSCNDGSRKFENPEGTHTLFFWLYDILSEHII